MSEIAGVDFSMARPSAASLTQAGLRLVLGYCSLTPAKNLTAADIASYVAAGLSVGLVWETTADRALAGATAGAADGAEADRQADSIGYGADCVVFFAVDQAVTLDQINGPIRAYATAFDAAMKRPAGVYGSYLVVDTLVTPGVRPVRYGWQTAAWSRDAAGNDQLSAKAHLYQRATPSGHWPVLPGTDEDVLCAPLPLMGPLHTAAASPTPPAAPPAPPSAPAAVARPPRFGWNLPGGHYYGNIAGPAVSHGGATPNERLFVRNIQQWLIYHGVAKDHYSWTWATDTWASGWWGAETDTAMALWHARFYPHQPQPTQCWADDYDRLARP